MGLMENGGGLSVADALALQDNNNNNGMFGGNGNWIFFLFFLLAWGNGGFGGFGGGGNAAAQGALTRAELYDGFNNQSVVSKLEGLGDGLCQGFYGQNVAMNQGFNGVNSAINGLGYAMKDCCCETNRNIDAVRFDASKCCCETNRNIDAVRYEGAKNTCDVITNANYNARDIIEAGNANTQRIIDHMTNNEMQSLREKLQAATFQISQQQQTADLMGKLRPCPVPAYPSCSPYQTFPINGCGCGY